MSGNPLRGAVYFIRGAKLLTHPGLRKFILVPLIVNVLLFVTAIVFGVEYFQSFLDWLIAKTPDWLDWLISALWLVFVLGALLVVFYTFTLVANFISAPFNGFLSAAVEAHVKGQAPQESSGSVWKEVVASLGQEGRKLWYLASRAMPLLILFLIPGINLAAPFVWLAFGAWLLALEYADFPMGNHSIRWAGVRERLKQRRLTALGFGGMVLVATAIPVVNFIVVPAAVIGATLMWVEELSTSIAE